MSGRSEFVYELQVCRWAELAWPPDDGESTAIVARQLGTKQRRWDTVVVEVDPEALAARHQFGDRELDSDLLHVVRHAPAEWAFYREALPHPGYPWRYVREAIHRAADRGIVDTRRDGNKIQIKRIAPYPDWVRRLIAIENKPDLDASAARQLADQLQHDVDTGLADEVWVATTKTGRRVEPALLESLPVEAGILTTAFAGGVDRESATIEWYPTRLQPAHDADYRAARRLELAERAYGRGWRNYGRTMRPDCRHFELRRDGRALLPWCAAKGYHQSSAVCSGSCGEFQPEPPAWRTRGWPIEGGPGKGIKRLLDDRAARYNGRDRADSGE
ncbi:MAG: DUF5787 family protein [Halohasta sp.]